MYRRDFERMLRRLVGERIQVVVNCASGLWQVRADPGEIGRAIMNLFLERQRCHAGRGYAGH